MRIFNTMAARAIPFVPHWLIRKISRRYIAGDTLHDAVPRIRALDAAGFDTTIDVLGETASTAAQADAMTRDYLDLIAALGADGLHAELSIKLTALGLLLDAPGCVARVERVLHAAARYGLQACIDMEDVSCTQRTLDLFASLEAAGHPVGIAVQAYLRRTRDDLPALTARRSRMRICKGIYAEAASHLVEGAAHDRRAINGPFFEYVVAAIEAGAFVGIATHDVQLIERLVAWIERERIDASRFEFQMLLGVCEPLRDRLRERGFRVRVYVPYGIDWYGYSVRRIKENPRIAGYVVAALFR
ncbi:proline dehydrogenase family protein [Burkholderia sp. 3C]